MKRLAIEFLIAAAIGIGILISAIWFTEGMLKKEYKRGWHDGYNKYIETLVPAPTLPQEIPVKRKARLIEKFKG
jgi:hypothetical protein